MIQKGSVKEQTLYTTGICINYVHDVSSLVKKGYELGEHEIGEKS